jgi:hypothetical protein
MSATTYKTTRCHIPDHNPRDIHYLPCVCLILIMLLLYFVPVASGVRQGTAGERGRDDVPSRSRGRRSGVGYGVWQVLKITLCVYQDSPLIPSSLKVTKIPNYLLSWSWYITKRCSAIHFPCSNFNPRAFVLWDEHELLKTSEIYRSMAVQVAITRIGGSEWKDSKEDGRVLFLMRVLGVHRL